MNYTTNTTITEQNLQLANSLDYNNSKNNIGSTFSDVNSQIYKEFEKNKDKEIFEKLITDLTIDIYSDDEETKKYILSLPKSKQRLATLLYLDKNNNLWTKMDSYIKGCDDNKLEQIKDVIRIINEFVKKGEVEKKKYGEVMTPISLVNDMLNKLPKDVWSNPNLKWLDPANGAGTFPSVVIYKLMNGLCKWQPDAELRYKHIVENMIYTCEIQSRNVFLWLCAVDPKDEYTVNAYWGSYLDDNFNYHMKNVWGIDKFDIIIGNPPYNAPMNANGKRGGGDTLWDKFVIKSISLLKKQIGLLCFIHPSLWRKPQTPSASSYDVSKLLINKQLLYLEIHDYKDGMKTFNAGTRYDFYVLENRIIYKDTIINTEDRKIVNVYLHNYKFIPNKNFDLVDKIICKDNDICVPIIYSRSMYGNDKQHVSVDKMTKTHTLPLIHSTPKNGIRYAYTTKDVGHFGIPKVIFGESGIYNAIIDIDGKYGMTNGVMGIEINNMEEALLIKKAIESDKFKLLLSSCMWSNFRIEWRLFLHIKKDFWKEFID